MDSIVTRASARGLHRHGFCCFSASKHVACPVLRVLAYLSKMGRTPQGYGESTGVLCAKCPACSFSTSRCVMQMSRQLLLPTRKVNFHL